MIARLKARVRAVRTELHALYLAARHPGTPWYAKALLAACLVYAVAPADLLPDFLPVLGFIDDLVFVPLALALAARFVPRAVLAECRGRAATLPAAWPWRRRATSRPESRS